ncbi:MAG TPA: lipocalin family protein [Flavobacterium sp.]|uniref:lipocalin family protein n=1 Tax=Flavobacterium sp. TaxID=239 RepID=UPI002F42A93A
MKNLIYILSIMLSTSCSNNDDKPQNNVPQELIGKWKIAEIYSSDGSSASWSPHDSGEIYDIWFKSNWTYVSFDNNENCNNGNFSINDNQITFYPCTSDYPLTIEVLTTETLILRDYFTPEVYKTKYSKISE